MASPRKRTNSTRQRDAIGAVLEEARGPLTAEEVWEKARAVLPRVGLRTVFRNLQEQVDDGALLRVAFPGHPPRYERRSSRHHPHFVCLACGQIYDLPCETPDVRKLCKPPRGFSVDGAELTLFGRCAACGKSD